MAGAMRKMAVYLGLVEDENEDYEAYEADDSYAQAVESQRGYRDRPSPTPEPRGSVRTFRDETAPHAAVRPVQSNPRPAAHVPTPADLYRITTLHPRTYNDARRIAEEFRDGTPVIMNLSEMNDSDAKRIIDFAAGLTFGLRGSIERVTTKVFLLSPMNVEIGEETRAQIEQGGFFNQS